MNRLTNADHLRMLFDREGPFVSYYGPHDAEGDIGTRLDALARDASAKGASPAALDAVEARLALPVFGEVGGRAVISAADGTTLTDTAHEGPESDVLFVDSLPYAAPLLEWDQWRVPHLAVTADRDVFEAVSFLPGEAPELRPIGTTATDAAESIAQTARTENIELVIVAGQAQAARDLQTRLIGVVPTTTELATVEAEGAALADAVVRTVADKVARRTVAILQEFRFLAQHDSAVQGVEATVASLAAGQGHVLLVHDDPSDERRAWFGRGAADIGLSDSQATPHSGRLVDVVIRSGLLQSMQVRIIPSTGPQGPDGDIAVLVRDPAPTVG